MDDRDRTGVPACLETEAEDNQGIYVYIWRARVRQTRAGSAQGGRASAEAL